MSYKRSHTRILRIAMALTAASFLLLPVTAAFADDEAPTVDEVIAKYLEARGGEEAWKKVETARMTATMSMPSMGVEAPFVIEFKRPNKIRVDITMQGMVMTNAYDGEVGWNVMPMMGKPDPEEMAEDQLKQLLDQADFDGPLMNYEEKGHQVELIGKEDLEGTPVYKLKVTKKSGDVVYSYIDAEYFLEIRQEGRQNIQGTEMETATTLGDYKEVDGLMIPHAYEVSFGGGPVMQTLTFDEIDFGAEIDDARFTMPEVEKKEEEETAAG